MRPTDWFYPSSSKQNTSPLAEAYQPIPAMSYQPPSEQSLGWAHPGNRRAEANLYLKNGDRALSFRVYDFGAVATSLCCNCHLALTSIPIGGWDLCPLCDKAAYVRSVALGYFEPWPHTTTADYLPGVIMPSWAAYLEPRPLEQQLLSYDLERIFKALVSELRIKEAQAYEGTLESFTAKFFA